MLAKEQTPLSHPKPLKIAVVGSYTRDLINFRGPLMAALSQRQHQVIAIGPEPLNLSQQQVMQRWGVQFRRYFLRRTSLSPWHDGRAVVSLAQVLKKICPDIVIVYAIKPTIYAGLIVTMFLPRSALYMIVSGRGFAFQGVTVPQRFIGFLVQAALRLALKRCQGVFFQNPDDFAMYREKNFLHPKMITRLVAGSGVDTDHFKYVPLPKIENKSLVFLMIARIIEDKGVREYVDAARLVKREYPAARFLLVGALEDRPRSISGAEVQSWVDDGVIEYLGELQDVRPALQTCHVFVLPSYAEGMPRTVLEAMSSGRAVLTTDVPGCRQAIEDGLSGKLVPVQDAVALATACKFLIDQPETVKLMGEEARRRCEKVFDVHQVNAEILAVIDP